jgi:DNA replication protein DnaC
MKYYEKQYIDNKQSKVKFISFPSLLMELKSTFDNKEKKEDVILNGFCTYDLLVLDDFGIWRNSDWLYNTLYILINERYENFKPTIFTSNIDIKTITKNLKDLRIPRRIVDMCIEIIEV